MAACSGAAATGNGGGRTRGQAQAAAVGEAIERFCLVAPRAIPARHREELEGRVFEPAAWPLFSDRQYDDPNFPFLRYDHDRERSWYRAISLITGEPQWLPSRLVLLTAAEPDDCFTSNTSTGAACHSDARRALLSGLYEAVERDALMILWEARARTPVLAADDPYHFPSVRHLARRCAATGRELILRNATTDLEVPVVVAVIVDRSGRYPALALGSAARSTLHAAADAATGEAMQSWAWMAEETATRPLTLAEVWERVRTPQSMMYHARLYSFPEMLDAAAPLIEEGPIARLPQPGAPTGASEQLKQLLSSLGAAGFDPLVADVTVPEVAYAGLRVLKSLVPGLVPMSVGTSCRHLANPRIEQVPRRLNWCHRGISIDQVPHPLP